MVGETQGGMRFDSNKEFILQRRLSSVYQNDSLISVSKPKIKE
jgi:hypothetical protein